MSELDRLTDDGCPHTDAETLEERVARLEAIQARYRRAIRVARFMAEHAGPFYRRRRWRRMAGRLEVRMWRECGLA